MKLRAEIKLQAKQGFQAQYGIAVGACVLFALLSSLGSGMTAGLAMIFLTPPVLVGYSFFNRRIYRGETGDIGEMFGIGFSDYGKSLGGVLWMYLFIWLWSLLFVIPGIVKSMAYFMTPYILADSKNVSATDALKLSMRMTQGYKGEIFVMYLSFIGWMILSAMTAGILYILYVGPYMNASFAGLYEELKANALARGTVRPEELA